MIHQLADVSFLATKCFLQGFSHFFSLSAPEWVLQNAMIYVPFWLSETRWNSLSLRVNEIFIPIKMKELNERKINKSEKLLPINIKAEFIFSNRFENTLLCKS